MEPPRGWRPSQGGRTLVPPSISRTRYQPDRPIPPPAGEQANDLSTLPRWKQFMLMYAVPVCMAMVWQLAVIIGFLTVFLIGLTLLKLLRS